MSNYKAKRFLKYFFQDNTGKYAVAQPPNVPVYIIIITYLLLRVVPAGSMHGVLEAINSGAVFLWAYLEIVYGESLFRRILGVIVMTVFLIGKFH